MTKLYAYLLGGLALVAAMLGLYAWGLGGHKAALQARNEAEAIATQLEGTKTALEAVWEARAVDRQLAAKRVAQAEARRQQAEHENKELRDALKDHPGWAAEPVPDSVWGAIEGTGPASAEGAPRPQPAR